MGPLEDIGPYTATVITTRKPDVDNVSDNKHEICSVLIGLLLLPVAFWTVCFMGLYIWAYRVPICVIGPMVIGFLACAHYGTNNRLIRRYGKHTLSERTRIARRLSDTKGV